MSQSLGGYGIVRHSFWTDPEIKRVLTPDQKTLLLYWFTGPHSNLVGLYYCPFTYAANETGIALESVRTWTIGPLSRFVTYDERTEEVFVHGAARQRIGAELKPKDKRIGAIQKALSEVHSRDLIERFLAKYSDWLTVIGCDPPREEKEGLRSPSEAPPKPLTEQYQEQYQDHSKSEQRSRTREPTDRPAPRATAEGVSIEEKADEVIRAANRGMVQNPEIGDRCHPIPLGHSSRQVVLEWLAEVPFGVVLEIVESRSLAWRREGNRRQITTMKYFEAAVREEWAKIREMESVNGRGGSSGGKARQKASGARGEDKYAVERASSG